MPVISTFSKWRQEDENFKVCPGLKNLWKERKGGKEGEKWRDHFFFQIPGKSDCFLIPKGLYLGSVAGRGWWGRGTPEGWTHDPPKCVL